MTYFIKLYYCLVSAEFSTDFGKKHGFKYTYLNRLLKWLVYENLKFYPKGQSANFLMLVKKLNMDIFDRKKKRK
jgi:hypothetical protein